MEDSLLVAAIVGLFCGIPLMVLGYLVGIKQKRNLLSSWDDMSYSDPKLVGFIMGTSVFITGLLILLASVAFILNILSMLQALLVISSSVVIPLFAALYVNVKHTRPS
ncbi:hypothetical protein LMJ53_09260 [Rheinheimera sp. UJ51]|uniref:hypothetical protein n=1 Tax=Rheinheimera sp. UJ51 TaxID=2892446 RepID=UPI001E60CECF|nr:hypothetical protein [Rheinheimera sp. UJ51]MCC5451909.1 hypothetical protein [Rheinheimera sp. UJ51]